jgi:hypothetical protein
MNSDNPIVLALIEEIESQLEGDGFNMSDLMVSRGSQPTSQHAGAVTDTAKYQVFITPITRSNLVMQRKDNVVVDEIQATYTHSNLMTFQIDCLTDFDPSDSSSIDGNNFAQTIKELLGHFDALLSLRGKGVSIVNCGAVRPSYTILNAGLYESTPSFDLQINYNSQRTKLLPSTGVVNGTMDRV